MSIHKLEDVVKEDEGVRVKNSGWFKLKDKAPRHFQAMNLKRQFGFIPEYIIIEKVAGANNTFFVRAVLTKEEEEREDREKARLERLEKLEKAKATKKKGGKNGTTKKEEKPTANPGA